MAEALPARIAQVKDAFAAKAPLFQRAVDDQLDTFGEDWATAFGEEIAVYFNDDIAMIENAVDGYGRFCIEAMRLQRRFDKTLRYDEISYAEALAAVYQNDEYMRTVYLPALLLSHYMWPHHFRQLQWVRENFFSRLTGGDFKTFCDVGIGTGFYSKELLRALPAIRGWGFDISDSSISHTDHMLQRWALSDRYTTRKQEVGKEVDGGFDCCLSVELLEHLEDPTVLLRSIRNVMRDDALGLLTAALDAPNRDHIYLYRDNDSVRRHIEAGGFEVLLEANFAAYEVDEDETVPQAACFIVQAR